MVLGLASRDLRQVRLCCMNLMGNLELGISENILLIMVLLLLIGEHGVAHLL